MTLVRYPSNTSRFSDLFNSDLFNSFFDTVPSKVTKKFTPAVNIKETESAYQLEIEVPGFSKEDFSIAIENNVLKIAGEKKTEESTDTTEYKRKEFGYQSFERSFTLPENGINEEEVAAAYNEGILYLDLPKLQVEEKEKIKRIAIK